MDEANELERLIYKKALEHYDSPMHRGASIDKIDERIRHHFEDSLASLFTPQPKGLLLTGPTGTGKTYAMYAVIYGYIKEWIRRVKPVNPHKEGDWNYLPDEYVADGYARNISSTVVFVTHFELVRYLRDTVSDEKDFRIGYLGKHILMVDDLGRGYDDQSGWNIALQDEYFDWRWKNLKPTFISTNKTPAELRSWPGWERMVDRFADKLTMTVIEMGGASKRKR